SVTVNVPPSVRVITTVLPSGAAWKPLIVFTDVASADATVARSVPEAVAVPNVVWPLERVTRQTSVAWKALDSVTVFVVSEPPASRAELPDAVTATVDVNGVVRVIVTVPLPVGEAVAPIAVARREANVSAVSPL